MKKIITVFLLWIFHFSCTAQWVELNINNVNASYFSDVYAITPDIVFLVGSNGTIMKTIDGGVTWVQKPSTTTLNLGEVQFPTSSIGYVTAADGKLLKTTNGGDSWITIDLGLNIIFLSLSCVNENLVFLSGINADSKSILYKSEDGGSTWEATIGNNTQTRLYNIQFLSGEIGYASDVYYPSSYNSKILKTQDGGKNWIPLENSKIPFSFINESIGFCYRGGLYKTTDAGNIFSSVTQNSEEFREIYAVNERNVWGILSGVLNGDGSTRGIMKISSTDSLVYEEITVYENNPQIDMLSLHFANETTGYIVGIKNGKATVWKNGTGINTSGDLSVADGIATSFKVYPNPASDKITISINSQFPKDNTVSVTDMSGKLIYSKNYINKNEITIDVRNFSKGTYILYMKNQHEKQIYSQKIIIK